jgi:neurotransmitter:Na+ symporter, NSS family
MSANREQFGSRLGFILAAAGSAVGIGNLVGFPVAAAKNGGGAFLLIYALFVIFICLPVMLAEISIGRHTQHAPMDAFRSLSKGHKGWTAGGFLALVTPYMIAVFYTVITIWLFGFLFETLAGNLDRLADPAYFGVFINSNDIFWYLIGVNIIVYFILFSGVKDGIEKGAKIMMPALFVMLILLVGFVLTLDNAFAGVKYYIVPDFSKINASVINTALSQAFFSLSLGMGIMITYGSYMQRDDDLPGSAKFVAFTDTAVAFCAGLLIMPAIFSFNPEINTAELSDSSVGLIFTFLPKIFLALQVSIGYVGASAVAAIFFLLVFFAAITSLVSITEVPNSAIMGSMKYSRKKSLTILGVSILFFSILCIYSFGRADWLTHFLSYGGAEKSFFDVIIDVFYDTVLPLNGLLSCLLVLFHWKRANFHRELERGAPAYRDSFLERYVDVSLTTFIPVILFVIFLNTVAFKYFGVSFIG